MTRRADSQGCRIEPVNQRTGRTGRGGGKRTGRRDQFGVLAARWIGMPPLEGQHFVLGAASFSMRGFEPRHPGVPIIARWNAVSNRTVDSGLELHACDNERTANTKAIERQDNEGGETRISGKRRSAWPDTNRKGVPHAHSAQ